MHIVKGSVALMLLINDDDDDDDNESWKPFYFGFKRSKVKVTSRKTVLAWVDGQTFGWMIKR